MRIRKTNLIRFSAFLIVFIIIFSLVSHIYTPTSLDFFSSPISATFAQFYNEPRNSIDLIMLGASTAEATLLPAVLWDEAGIISYNLAISSGRPAVMYYWLKEALKYQSPSVVVFCGRQLFVKEDVDRNEARFRQGLDNMRLSRNKIDAINDIVSKSKEQKFLDYLFPLLRYHSRQKLEKDDFNFKYLVERNISMGGRTYIRHRETQLPDDFWSEKRETGSSVNGEYLEKIIELCNANNIEVVMADNPTTVNNSWSIARHNAMQDFANAHGIKMIDFNMREYWEKTNLDESMDFADPNHVNLIGGTKVSRYFAHYLSETFNLPDGRAGEYDPHWDKVMEFYNIHYSRFNEVLQIKQCTTFSEYLSLLKKFTNSYIFISTRGEFAKYLNDIDKEALKALGLQTELSAALSNRSYYAIINDGSVIREKGSKGRLEYDGYLYPFDVNIKSAGDLSNIKTNETQRSRNRGGFNIVVYDKLTERFIDSVCFDTSSQEVDVNR